MNLERMQAWDKHIRSLRIECVKQHVAKAKELARFVEV